MQVLMGAVFWVLSSWALPSLVLSPWALGPVLLGRCSPASALTLTLFRQRFSASPFYQCLIQRADDAFDAGNECSTGNQLVSVSDFWRQETVGGWALYPFAEQSNGGCGAWGGFCLGITAAH